jgi:hypothetical protein
VNFPGREHDQGLAQAILAQAADAIIFADTEGVIRIWNAAPLAFEFRQVAEAHGCPEIPRRYGTSGLNR